MKNKTHRLGRFLSVATILIGTAPCDVISNFDFTGPPWSAPKEADFNTFAALAQSVDADVNSITSPLTNNGGSGEPYDGGGYASFYVRDADLPTINPGIFSTSNTPGVGLNVANADDLIASNYLAFKVLPDPGFETTYQSLNFFSSSFLGDDTYDIELRAVLPGSMTETTLGTYQRTMPTGENGPVAAGSIDFPDFAASGPTEFRIYVYNIGQTNGGFRLDDLILNGVTATGGSPGIVLAEHTFDGVANDLGPDLQQVSNGLGVGGSSNLATGLITTGNRNDSTYGFNSSVVLDVEALDPLAIGVTATFEVVATTVSVSTLTGNGLFFGVVSGSEAAGTTGPSLWNNDPDSFGYVAGSLNYGDHVMRQDGATDYPLFTGVPSNGSFQDGFTVTVRVFKDDTWWVTSSGLSTELNQTGSLNAEDFNYSDIVNDLGLFVSLQGQASGSIEVAQISLRTIVGPPVVGDELEILSTTKLGDVFTVNFKGVDGATYALNKSATLDFSSLNSQGTITLSGTNVGVLQDFNATGESAFYRIEEQ